MQQAVIDQEHNMLQRTDFLYIWPTTDGREIAVATSEYKNSRRNDVNYFPALDFDGLIGSGPWLVYELASIIKHGKIVFGICMIVCLQEQEPFMYQRLIINRKQLWTT